MATTGNGWPVLDAGSDMLHTFTVPGANRRLTLHRGAAGLILVWWASFWNDKIERLDAPGGEAVDEGGYVKRPIANTNTYSEHAAGRAIDLNWNKHPSGVPAKYNLTADQIKRIHRRMRLINVFAGAKILEWGGDWPSWSGSTAKPDPMHTQIGRVSNATVQRVGRWLGRTTRGVRVLKANPGLRALVYDK
jgi:hypothetical protein